jgi:mRNA capping enzyme, C-terminal domain
MHVHIFPDTKKLNRDIGRSREKDNIIIECYFDSVSGIWQYHGIRQDKHKPNFIQTVFDTMENIVETITDEVPVDDGGLELWDYFNSKQTK